MPGPAPTPNPRRRNARPGVVNLPAEGYQGDIPHWPLSFPTMEEEDCWNQLWRLPQAAAWAQMHLDRTVARYVRALLVAEAPGAYTAALAEVRQIEDRLGLTPMSMLRLRWEVSTDEVAVARAEQPFRPRLVAVDPKAIEETG